MKRIILSILLISLLSFGLLFAASPSDENTTRTIYGYYIGAGSDKKIVLSIKDALNTAVYQTSTITVNAEDAVYDYNNDSFSFDAFNWNLSGLNYGGTVSISFTFTALLAYLAANGNYYVPVHQFHMTLDDNSRLTNVTNTYSSIGSPVTTGNKSVYSLAAYDKDAVYSSYPYGGSSGANSGYSGDAIYRDITFVFSEPAPDENSNGDVEWEESGTCSIDVTSYFHMAGGAVFHYNSNVTVEVTVN